MTTTGYNFIERYRSLMPVAPREVVEARQNAYAQLLKEFSGKMNRTYALLGLAFQQDKQGPLFAEFEKTVHEFDDHFFLNIDRAEAARIAALLLENMVLENRPIVAMAILASSFCGRRIPAGDGRLLDQSKNVIERVGSTRQVIGQVAAVAAKSADELKPSLDEMVASLTGQTVRVVFEALLGEVKKTQEALAKSATSAIRAENAALAQEVDMLWWNMGNWSDALGRSRQDLAPAVAGLVAGYELGKFVATPPGPYGAYGILRHALGESADQHTTLKETVPKLGQDAVAIARTIPKSARSLFPVTAAIAEFAADGNRAWDALAADIGDVVGLEISHFELAVQAYREAVLVGWGGLE